MNLPSVAPEIAARLANYGLDDDARAILRDMAPLLDGEIEEQRLRENAAAPCKDAAR